MANVIQSTLVYNADLSAAMAQIKALTAQVGMLNASMNSLDANAARTKAALASTFAANIASTGAFTAKTVEMRSATEQFGRAIAANKLTMREYFTEAFRGITRQDSLLRQFARNQARYMESIAVPMGTGPDGRPSAMMLTPNAIDMRNAQTRMNVMNQQFATFRQLVNSGAQEMINLGKNTQWTGRQLTVGLTMPVVLFSAAFAKAFMSVDKELTRFAKVYGEDLVGEIDNSTEIMKAKVMDLAKTISSQYGVAAAETAALAADIAATGKEGQDLLDTVAQTSRLAVLGEVDRQEAMKATLAIQTAFKQNTDELAESINFLNAVENQTSTTLNDLVEAIPKAGPVVKGLGGSIKDLSVLMVAMKEGGIPAAEAANAIKSGLASLINPTKKASEVAKQFGVDLVGIVNANKGQLMPTLSAVQEALNGLDSFSKSRIIEEIFGKYQFARISALFNNLGKAGSQTQQAMELAGASTSQLASIANKELKAYTESTTVRFQRMMETVKNQLLPVGEAMLKILTPALEKISGAIETVGNLFGKLPDQAKSFLGIIGGFALVAGPILMLAGLFKQLIGNSLKFAMGIVTLGAKISGLRTEKFQVLDENVMSAQLNVDKLTTSFYTQQQALHRVTTELSLYVKQLERAAALNPQMFITGPPVAATGRHAAPAQPIRRSRGSDQPEVVPGGYGGGDRIPALLEPGEFVIRKEAAARFAPVLRAINNGSIGMFSKGKTGSEQATGGAKTVFAHSISSVQDPETKDRTYFAAGFDISEKMNSDLNTRSRVVDKDEYIAAISAPDATSTMVDKFIKLYGLPKEEAQRLVASYRDELVRRLRVSTHTRINDGDVYAITDEIESSTSADASGARKALGVARQLQVSSGGMSIKAALIEAGLVRRYAKSGEIMLTPTGQPRTSQSATIKTVGRTEEEVTNDLKNKLIEQGVPEDKAGEIATQLRTKENNVRDSDGRSRKMQVPRFLPGETKPLFEIIPKTDTTPLRIAARVRSSKYEGKYSQGTDMYEIDEDGNLTDRGRSRGEGRGTDRYKLATGPDRIVQDGKPFTVVALEDGEATIPKEQRASGAFIDKDGRVLPNVGRFGLKYITGEGGIVTDSGSARKTEKLGRHAAGPPTDIIDQFYDDLRETGPQADLEEKRQREQQRRQQSMGNRGMTLMNVGFMGSMAAGMMAMNGEANAAADALSKLTMVVMGLGTVMQMLSMRGGGAGGGAGFLGLGAAGRKLTDAGMARRAAAVASGPNLAVGRHAMSSAGAGLMRAGGMLSMLGGPWGMAAAAALAVGTTAFIMMRNAAEEARERAISAFRDPVATAQYFGKTITSVKDQMKQIALEAQAGEENVSQLDQSLKDAVKQDYAPLIERLTYSSAQSGAQLLATAFNRMVLSGLSADEAKMAIQAIAEEAGASGGAAFTQGIREGLLRDKTTQEILDETVKTFSPENMSALRQGLEQERQLIEEQLNKHYLQMNLMAAIPFAGPAIAIGKNFFDSEFKDLENRYDQINKDIMETFDISAGEMVGLAETFFLAYKKAPEETIAAFRELQQQAIITPGIDYESGAVEDFLKESGGIFGTRLANIANDGGESAGLKLTEGIIAGIDPTRLYFAYVNALAVGGQAAAEAAVTALIDTKTELDNAAVETEEAKKAIFEDFVDNELTPKLQKAETAVQDAIDARDKLINRREQGAKRLQKAFDEEQQGYQDEIDLLEKEQDAIQTAADVYIESLEKRSEADDFYAQQKKTNMSALEALAAGDVFGFITTRMEANANANQYGYDQAIRQIEERRDAEIDGIQLVIDKKQELMDLNARAHEDDMEYYNRHSRRVIELENKKIRIAQDEVTRQRTTLDTLSTKELVSYGEMEKTYETHIANKYKTFIQDLMRKAYTEEQYRLNYFPEESLEKSNARLASLFKSFYGIGGQERRRFSTTRAMEQELSLPPLVDPFPNGTTGTTGTTGTPGTPGIPGTAPPPPQAGGAHTVRYNGTIWDWNPQEQKWYPREQLASGGYISGPGTSTSDSIPALLSNGEYVIRASSVDKVGTRFLDALNEGRLPGFRDGGRADFTSLYGAAAAGAGGAQYRTPFDLTAAAGAGGAAASNLQRATSNPFVGFLSNPDAYMQDYIKDTFQSYRDAAGYILTGGQPQRAPGLYEFVTGSKVEDYNPLMGAINAAITALDFIPGVGKITGAIAHAALVPVLKKMVDRAGLKLTEDAIEKAAQAAVDAGIAAGQILDIQDSSIETARRLATQRRLLSTSPNTTGALPLKASDKKRSAKVEIPGFGIVEINDPKGLAAGPLGAVLPPEPGSLIKVETPMDSRVSATREETVIDSMINASADDIEYLATIFQNPSITLASTRSTRYSVADVGKQDSPMEISFAQIDPRIIESPEAFNLFSESEQVMVALSGGLDNEFSGIGRWWQNANSVEQRGLVVSLLRDTLANNEIKTIDDLYKVGFPLDKAITKEKLYSLFKAPLTVNASAKEKKAYEEKILTFLRRASGVDTSLISAESDVVDIITGLPVGPVSSQTLSFLREGSLDFLPEMSPQGSLFRTNETVAGPVLTSLNFDFAARSGPESITYNENYEDFIVGAALAALMDQRAQHGVVPSIGEQIITDLGLWDSWSPYVEAARKHVSGRRIDSSSKLSQQEILEQRKNDFYAALEERLKPGGADNTFMTMEEAEITQWTEDALEKIGFRQEDYATYDDYFEAIEAEELRRLSIAAEQNYAQTTMTKSEYEAHKEVLRIALERGLLKVDPLRPGFAREYYGGETKVPTSVARKLGSIIDYPVGSRVTQMSPYEYSMGMSTYIQAMMKQEAERGKVVSLFGNQEDVQLPLPFAAGGYVGKRLRMNRGGGPVFDYSGFAKAAGAGGGVTPTFTPFGQAVASGISSAFNFIKDIGYSVFDQGRIALGYGAETLSAMSDGVHTVSSISPNANASFSPKVNPETLLGTRFGSTLSGRTPEEYAGLTEADKLWAMGMTAANLLPLPIGIGIKTGSRVVRPITQGLARAGRAFFQGSHYDDGVKYGFRYAKAQALDELAILRDQIFPRQRLIKDLKNDAIHGAQNLTEEELKALIKSFPIMAGKPFMMHGTRAPLDEFGPRTFEQETKTNLLGYGAYTTNSPGTGSGYMMRSSRGVILKAEGPEGKLLDLMRYGKPIPKEDIQIVKEYLNNLTLRHSDVTGNNVEFKLPALSDEEFNSIIVNMENRRRHGDDGASLINHVTSAYLDRILDSHRSTVYFDRYLQTLGLNAYSGDDYGDLISHTIIKNQVLKGFEKAGYVGIQHTGGFLTGMPYRATTRMYFNPEQVSLSPLYQYRDAKVPDYVNYAKGGYVGKRLRMNRGGGPVYDYSGFANAAGAGGAQYRTPFDLTAAAGAGGGYKPVLPSQPEQTTNPFVGFMMNPGSYMQDFIKDTVQSYRDAAGFIITGGQPQKYPSDFYKFITGRELDQFNYENQLLNASLVGLEFIPGFGKLIGAAARPILTPLVSAIAKNTRRILPIPRIKSGPLRSGMPDVTPYDKTSFIDSLVESVKDEHGIVLDRKKLEERFSYATTPQEFEFDAQSLTNLLETAKSLGYPKEIVDHVGRLYNLTLKDINSDLRTVNEIIDNYRSESLVQLTGIDEFAQADRYLNSRGEFQAIYDNYGLINKEYNKYKLMNPNIMTEEAKDALAILETARNDYIQEFVSRIDRSARLPKDEKEFIEREIELVKQDILEPNFPDMLRQNSLLANYGMTEEDYRFLQLSDPGEYEKITEELNYFVDRIMDNPEAYIESRRASIAETAAEELAKERRGIRVPVPDAESLIKTLDPELLSIEKQLNLIKNNPDEWSRLSKEYNDLLEQKIDDYESTSNISKAIYGPMRIPSYSDKIESLYYDQIDEMRDSLPDSAASLNKLFGFDQFGQGPPPEWFTGFAKGGYVGKRMRMQKGGILSPELNEKLTKFFNPALPTIGSFVSGPMGSAFAVGSQPPQMASGDGKKDVVSWLRQAGWPEHLLRIAYAIVMRESGGDPTKHLGPWNAPGLYGEGNSDIGLFQINEKGYGKQPWYDVEKLKDPVYNAAVAWQYISQSGKNFLPWAMRVREDGGFDWDWSYYAGSDFFAPGSEGRQMTIDNTMAHWESFPGYKMGGLIKKFQNGGQVSTSPVIDSWLRRGRSANAIFISGPMAPSPNAQFPGENPSSTTYTSSAIPTSTNALPPAYNPATTDGQLAVNYGRSLNGTPYGTGPGQLDCSDFTALAYNKGVPRGTEKYGLIDYSESQIMASIIKQRRQSGEAGDGSAPEIPESGLQPGDLIYFKNTGLGESGRHIGLYHSIGQMIHSGGPSPARVQIIPLQSEWNKMFFDAAGTPKAKFAYGGYISGPGTSTSDSIPALLSNGEYVIKASSVKKVGTAMLDAINGGDVGPQYALGGMVRKYKNGGLVGGTFGMDMTQSSAGSSVGVGGTIVNNTLNNQPSNYNIVINASGIKSPEMAKVVADMVVGKINSESSRRMHGRRI